MEFRARRFVPPPAGQADAPQVAGNWDLHRTAQDNSKLDVSWSLYLRQSGSEVSGAILKTSGDTDTLTGRWKDGVLRMSHFAGERPLLFEAKLNPDGTLDITLDNQFTYRAARTTEARVKGIPEPPDPSRFTLHGCDINSLTRPGTKTRSGQRCEECLPANSGEKC